MKTLIPLMLLLACSSASAEIYKWVDSNGKVHYGNRKNSGSVQPAAAQVVAVKDKYSIPSITENSPIAYDNNQAARMVSISRLRIDMPGADEGLVRIGRITCGRPIDLYWVEGNSDVRSQAVVDGVINTFKDAGYRAESSIKSAASGGALVLDLSIADIEMSECNPAGYPRNFTQNNTYMDLNWKLRDPFSGDVIFSGNTKGSHHASQFKAKKGGAVISIEKAASAATNNVLNDPEFVKHLQHIDLSQFKALTAGEQMDLPFKTDAFSDFESKAEYLKEASVTVRTKNGHGSGVILTEDGHVFTNAHVVGDETEFTIATVSRQYTAHLIRKDDVRDVALLKIKNYRGDAVAPIHTEKASIGESIFIIGTPLKETFSHTITSGIISAHRKFDGLPYYQTDASINRGNSGGPVFNKKGQVIGLSVAGHFTRDGASLNLNYLIPIEDAIDAMNITDVQPANPITKKLDAIDSPKVRGFVESALSWLNEPIFNIYGDRKL